MKLYVGNLSYDMNEAELRELFTPFGEPDSAKVITDRDTGRSKGFGFVEFADNAQATAAMNALNGKRNGRALTVTGASADRVFRRPAGRWRGPIDARPRRGSPMTAKNPVISKNVATPVPARTETVYSSPDSRWLTHLENAGLLKPGATLRILTNRKLKRISLPGAVGG
jgi:RNA recognition motif-containing protein